MKKYTLYILLLIAGMINCQQDEIQENKASVYQDIRRFGELSQKIENKTKLQEASNKINRLGSKLMSELRTCEEAGDCETSESLKITFEQFAMASLDVQNISKDIQDLVEAKELRELLGKYAQ